jgi:Lon protease-like protein
MPIQGHATRREDLPSELPVFPLSGVLLLPRGTLPLNIFEPRYLAMTRDALAPPRLIGMIQPTTAEGERDPAVKPPLYGVGCAGRVTAFSETEDGRFVLTLTGVARFEVEQELGMCSGYRRMRVRWQRFEADLGPEEGQIARPALMKALKPFFETRGLKADFDQLGKLADERLVTMLAMACPFDPQEKQALLEAPDLTRRAELLRGLLEMAVRTPPQEPTETLRKH